MGTVNQEDDSDAKGEVDLNPKLMSSLEELRNRRMEKKIFETTIVKIRKRGREFKTRTSKIQERSREAKTLVVY